MTLKSLDFNIENVIKDDLDFLELEIKKIFDNRTKLDTDLYNFLSFHAKRFRPILGFLFLRAVFGEINVEQKNILLAVELIHNATLIHDDVIDEAQSRRGQTAFNLKFNNNLAVVSGDFLLSLAMEKILEAKSVEVLNVFADALKSVCIGEINQYYLKSQVPALEDYIEKSKQKTATLFTTGIIGGILVSNEKSNQKLLNIASDFAQNFGIAFQVRDDLLNIINGGDDVSSGIYTAPVIFASMDNPDLLNTEGIIDAVKCTQALVNTKDLMDNYFDKAVSSIETIDKSDYKSAILNLIESLRVKL